MILCPGAPLLSKGSYKSQRCYKWLSIMEIKLLHLKSYSIYEIKKVSMTMCWARSGMIAIYSITFAFQHLFCKGTSTATFPSLTWLSLRNRLHGAQNQKKCFCSAIGTNCSLQNWMLKRTPILIQSSVDIVEHMFKILMELFYMHNFHCS